jgi:hypothetical protein
MPRACARDYGGPVSGPPIRLNSLLDGKAVPETVMKQFPGMRPMRLFKSTDVPPEAS